MIEINNLTTISLHKKFLKKSGEKVFRGEKIKKETELSVAFVSPQRIKDLNKRYLKRNMVTSVLSFPDQKEKFQFRPRKKITLGEIIICPSEVKKIAKKYRIPFEAELVRVLIHGILNLLGYNQEKSKKAAQKMEEREQYYLSQIFKSQFKIHGKSLFYRRS